VGRIFIDVTQSCRSSNNSGIQVVTRNLFREINDLHETIPMIWDDRLRRYAHLSRTERKNLENPFSKGYKPKARPNKQENPFYKELLSTLLRLRKRISLTKKPEEEDLLFFPEVFRDNRVFCLPKLLHKKSRKAAIFYDANVLRKPEDTPQTRLKNFQTYLDFLSGCDAISCISEESREAFEAHALKPIEARRTEVHHLPVEQPVSTPSIPLRDPPLILCVSTLGYNKNHLTLLEAVEKLWVDGVQFELELVGQSDPSWTPKVLKVLDQLISRNRPVKWLRHVDQDTLEEKYASCSFSVYPSLYEGFGLPILESLIRGKPCICGKNGALGEVSRDGGCLIIEDQQDPGLLGNAIRKLLSADALRQTLCTEAQKRDFGNWKRYSSDLLSLFLGKGQA
jgi:glycosyltransferase involved in cell wall biosynthesis